MKSRHKPRRSSRVLRSVGVIAGVSGAALFIFWNADIWVLRDKIEHMRAALFGPYVAPVCRKEPDTCRKGKPIPKLKAKPVSDVCADKPGLKLHCEFQTLYAFFNKELFENRLPPAVITLQRKRGAAGYFSYRRFKAPNGETIDEIALNPSTFNRVSMLRLASTLVHEQIHLEQAHFGTPGKGGFHNAEWGRMMRRVGLEPSHTGRPGGRATGVRMTHFIVPGGPFERAARTHPLINNRKVALAE